MWNIDEHHKLAVLHPSFRLLLSQIQPHSAWVFFFLVFLPLDLCGRTWLMSDHQSIAGCFVPFHISMCWWASNNTQACDVGDRLMRHVVVSVVVVVVVVVIVPCFLVQREIWPFHELGLIFAVRRKVWATPRHSATFPVYLCLDFYNMTFCCTYNWEALSNLSTICEFRRTRNVFYCILLFSARVIFDLRDWNIRTYCIITWSKVHQGQLNTPL